MTRALGGGGDDEVSASACESLSLAAAAAVGGGDAGLNQFRISSYCVFQRHHHRCTNFITTISHQPTLMSDDL